MTRESLAGLRAAVRLVNCPNCDGTGRVAIWYLDRDLTETCRIPECDGSGRVTIAERDAILERLDGLQRRSRP